MFVFLISLTLLWLSYNNGDLLLEERDVYHTLFGNIGSMDDLFLKEPNATAPEPAPDAVPAADDNETLDEPEMEMADAFGYLRTNLTNQTFDVLDFFMINEKYSNFTKEHKNKLQKNTRRDDWTDPDDRYFGESLEKVKKQQLRMILAQFALHCRYEVGKALLQREFVRHDKRYKLGYLFNRMRRLKTEQLKMTGAARHQNFTDYRHFYSVMRMYERVVHFDVDMRDTANLIKQIYSKEEEYDTYKVQKVKNNDDDLDSIKKP